MAHGIGLFFDKNSALAKQLIGSPQAKKARSDLTAFSPSQLLGLAAILGGNFI
jgi:hypothetical protein